MQPIDFKDTKPELILENYFSGKTKAWGIFQDRFGNLRRQFTVDIVGVWDGKNLILDEKFHYSDGEKEQRIWKIKKVGFNKYEGTASDVVGTANGLIQGNALNWRYDMRLKSSNGSWVVHFNDWMFLQSPHVLLNRAEVSKFGLEIGTVTIAFVKDKAGKSMSNEYLSGLSTNIDTLVGAQQ